MAVTISSAPRARIVQEISSHVRYKKFPSPIPQNISSFCLIPPFQRLPALSACLSYALADTHHETPLPIIITFANNFPTETPPCSPLSALSHSLLSANSKLARSVDDDVGNGFLAVIHRDRNPLVARLVHPILDQAQGGPELPPCHRRQLIDIDSVGLLVLGGEGGSVLSRRGADGGIRRIGGAVNDGNSTVDQCFDVTAVLFVLRVDLNVEGGAQGAPLDQTGVLTWD